MRKIRHTLIDSNLEDFLYRFIKSYDAMFMNSGITETEVRYLVQLVTIHRQGISIASKKANRLLKQFFNTKDKDRSIWIYRGKLKKRGWLVQTPETVELHPALQGKFEKIQWDVKMEYESDRADNSKGNRVSS